MIRAAIGALFSPFVESGATPTNSNAPVAAPPQDDGRAEGGAVSADSAALHPVPRLPVSMPVGGVPDRVTDDMGRMTGVLPQTHPALPSVGSFCDGGAL